MLLELAMFQTSATSFFFQTIFQNVANSTWSSSLSSPVTTASMAILAVIFLVSVYEAFAGGGNFRGLLIALAKTAACALIISNWYTFFTDISGGVTNIAVSITGSSNDFIQQYSSTLDNTFQTNSNSFLGTIVFTGVLEMLNDAIMFVAIIVYYLAMLWTEFLYTAWGLVLLATGPFLVALLPSRATAGFAKEWFKSLAQWASWPLIYAIIAVLGMDVNGGGGTNYFNNINSPTSSATGAAATFLTSIQGDVLALLYVIMLVLIPFIAHAIIKGNFAGAASAVQGAISKIASAAAPPSAAVQAAAAMKSAAGGMSAAASGMGAAAAGMGAAAGGQMVAAAGQMAAAGSPPPSPVGTGRPGGQGMPGSGGDSGGRVDLSEGGAPPIDGR